MGGITNASPGINSTTNCESGAIPRGGRKIVASWLVRAANYCFKDYRYVFIMRSVEEDLALPPPVTPLAPALIFGRFQFLGNGVDFSPPLLLSLSLSFLLPSPSLTVSLRLWIILTSYNQPPSSPPLPNPLASTASVSPNHPTVYSPRKALMPALHPRTPRFRVPWNKRDTAAKK